jgi:acyl-CoA thioester hydrolase
MRKLPDHEVQLRWDDLDVLNHVNNVRYLVFADDARAALVERGDIGAAHPIGGCDVEYQSPLAPTGAPVVITAALEGEVLTQKVTSLPPSGQVVHATVVTELSPDPGASPPTALVGAETAHLLRAGDMDGRWLRNAALFGLFQESRIVALDRRHHVGLDERVVVARTMVRYVAPIPMRRTPYLMRLGLERLGRASMTVRLQLTTESGVLADARAVIVAYNALTQRSRAFREDERQEILSSLPALAAEDVG